MTSQQIRQQFIDFFKDKKHTFVPSASVVPLDDPTLLFTNAGMNQFKDVFLGKGQRSYSRAVNSQKCIRVSGKHNDLEEVGHDTYHHTFFEMLGNWSFGDYYKEEAIRWAWELLTGVWKLPKEKLYATVHDSDDEALEIWSRVTDINPKHILKFGDKDNFWEMGATGPCGPCSEIHIDRGPEFDDPATAGKSFVNSGSPRYIELWNLVFIQYFRDESGTLHALPNKHVDTGAGFERLVSVLQNTKSNYLTDVFSPVIDLIGEMCGTPFAQSGEQAAYNVIADHLRMLSFSIADGGLPSNEGRGYVMRRILRRAARYGRKLNFREPFIYKLVDRLADVMGEAYPELRSRQAHIERVIQSEEEHFNRTLDRGLEIFDKIHQDLKMKNELIIPGAEVFKLYDTYGFPVDLTRVLADEHGLNLDMAGFDEEMEIQRERARAAAHFAAADLRESDWMILNEGHHSKFVGYDELAIETHIMRYHQQGNQLQLVLRETPFYAESGGQLGDKGSISGEGFELQINDTRKDGDRYLHLAEIDGVFSPMSDKVVAEVTESTRRATAKNHTATHLLQAALRRVLGSHIAQAGSLVAHDRLRFDFSHFERISNEQLTEIERLINQKIQENITLHIAQEKFIEAKSRGAMALFGEKYGDVVRTIQIADYSLELCGGTHVRSTGEIGLFLITEETSVAAGVRRIEAITGPVAVQQTQKMQTQIKSLAQELNTPAENLLEKVQQLQEQKKQLEKDLLKLASARILSDLDSLLASAEPVNGVLVITKTWPDISTDQLKELGDSIRAKAKNTAALLISETEGKLNLVCALTDDLIKERGLKAGDLVKAAAQAGGGSGGGRPHLATAGAKEAGKLNEVFQAFKNQF